MSKKKTKKGLNIFLKVLFIIILILALIFSLAFFYIKSKLDKIRKIELPSNEELGITASIAQNLTDYKNIAIFGVDSRSDDYGIGNRSDCIIIASINNTTGEVKLISVYRDTYVNIDGYGLDKITHAYSYGEASLAIKTLNKNLDLNINDFITVNFDSVANAVDKLGGIQLSVTSDEIKYINNYIDETSKITGKSSTYITKSGTYVLDGVQAVAYSRIRYTDGGDYKRAERMRTVIEAMFNKLKTMSISEINSFANALLPEVYSNISLTDIVSFLPNLHKYKITTSIGWPYVTKGKTMDRWYGIPVTLESNVIQLHKEAFDDVDYIPSDTVKLISQSIVDKTGYSD